MDKFCRINHLLLLQQRWWKSNKNGSLVFHTSHLSNLVTRFVHVIFLACFLTSSPSHWSVRAAWLCKWGTQQRHTERRHSKQLGHTDATVTHKRKALDSTVSDQYRRHNASQVTQTAVKASSAHNIRYINTAKRTLSKLLSTTKI